MLELIHEELLNQLSEEGEVEEVDYIQKQEKNASYPKRID